MSGALWHILMKSAIIWTVEKVAAKDSVWEPKVCDVPVGYAVLCGVGKVLR